MKGRRANQALMSPNERISGFRFFVRPAISINPMGISIIQYYNINPMYPMCIPDNHLGFVQTQSLVICCTGKTVTNWLNHTLGQAEQDCARQKVVPLEQDLGPFPSLLIVVFECLWPFSIKSIMCWPKDCCQPVASVKRAHVGPPLGDTRRPTSLTTELLPVLRPSKLRCRVPMWHRQRAVPWHHGALPGPGTFWHRQRGIGALGTGSPGDRRPSCQLSEMKWMSYNVVILIRNTKNSPIPINQPFTNH